MIDLLIKEIEKDKNKVLNFISDNTPTKKGIYMKIDIDKPFDKDSFKDYFVASNRSSDTSTFQCELDMIERENLIDYMRHRDLLSGLLNDDVNKTIDGASKKILSGTYQTLSIKKEFTDFNKDKPAFKSADEFCNLICEKGLDSYRKIGEKIKITLNLKKLKYNDENLEKEFEFISSEARINEINLIEYYLKINFSSIIDFINTKDISLDSKIKLFFYSKSNKIRDSIADYEREYSYYLSNYIFNKGTTRIINGQLKGAIPYGFNNNSSKKYIKPTRMNIEYIKMHSLDEALNVRLAFDLLKIISDNRSAKLFGFNNLNKETQFICNLDEFVKTSNDNKTVYFKLQYKDKYIEEYDLIAEKTNFNTMTVKDKIKLNNYLNKNIDINKKDNSENKADKSIYGVKELLANMIFCSEDSFNKYDDYYMVGIDSKDNGNLMLSNRNDVIFNKYKHIFHDFLTSSSPSKNLIDFVINKYTSEGIKSYINSMYASKHFKSKIIRLLNIKINLMNKYIGENDLMNTIKNMNEKLLAFKNNNRELAIENDSEYYFLLGQLSLYLESRLKGDTDFSIFKFYTEKRDIKNIKKYLIQRFELVSYDIGLGHLIFKSIFEIVLSYTPATKINENIEMFYIGVCSDNIFYKDKDNKKDNKE